MALELHRLAENGRTVTFYKGPNIDSMPELLGDRRVPVNFAQIMRQRLTILNDPDCPRLLITEWCDKYIASGDGARRNTDGTLKLAYDSASLRTINPESRLSEGALILTPEQYALGDGPHFTKKQVDTYTGHRHRSVKQAMQNPIYVEGLARGDKALARAYAQALFVKYDETLGIHAPSVQGLPIERLWIASSLDYIFRGDVDGDADLDEDGSGRLAGVHRGRPLRPGNGTL